MIKQTVKFALRSFRKSTLVHFLNVVGLTLGLSVYFLVTLYLYQENSYERGFSNHDRIFQISYTMIGHKMAKGAPNLWYVLDEVPEIEAHTSFKIGPTTSVKFDGQESTARVFTVDSAFLKIFDFEFISGVAESVLRKPDYAVLSESYALELFGTTDVVNKSFEVKKSVSLDSSYQVPIVINGVVKNPSFKTQLEFDILISEEKRPNNNLTLGGWQNSSVYNYVLAAPGTSKEKLDGRLFDLGYKYIQPKTMGKIVSKEDWKNEPLYCGFYAESLSELRLNSESSGNLMPSMDEAQINTMAIVALAALIISILNFVSLSTARASARMKEVGVKRILGSSKKQLILQFMTESLLVIMLSSIIALAVVEALVKLNTDLVGIQVDYSVLQTTEWVLGLIAFVLILTLISGVYPAIYLSSANLSGVLRNGTVKKSFSILNAAALRRGTAILQFTCSSGLIIAVITMFLQVNHLKTRDIGYDPYSVLVVNTFYLGESKNAFRDQLSKYPSISSASYVSKLPLKESMDLPMSLKLSDSTEMAFTHFYADDTFFETASMNFVAGYGFKHFEGSTKIELSENEGSSSPRRRPVVINEVAAKIIGYETSSPKEIQDKRFQIIGVVNDFIFSDLRQELGPVVIMRKSSNARPTYHYPLLVKVNDTKRARADIEELWSEFSDEPLNIDLMESSYVNLLKVEEDGLRAVLIFSVLSVLVSCLGLFGLAVFTLDQRIHEFGIRKVLGASVSDIMKLFGSGFIKLIVLAFVLATPASIYLLNNWLSIYADRISLTFNMFLAAGIVVMLIVGLTLLAQSLKAGRLNPIETLRNE